MNTNNETKRIIRHMTDIKTIIAEAVITVLVIMCTLAGLLYAAILHEGQKTRDFIATQYAEATAETAEIGEAQELRAVKAIVHSTQDGYTTLEDETGNLWDIDGEIVGNPAIMIWIDNKGTMEIDDDEVVNIWCQWNNR